MTKGSMGRSSQWLKLSNLKIMIPQAGGESQVVEFLLSKSEALNSNSSTAKNINK
jgi:hypothetical protein